MGFCPTTILPETSKSFSKAKGWILRLSFQTDQLPKLGQRTGFSFLFEWRLKSQYMLRFSHEGDNNNEMQRWVQVSSFFLWGKCLWCLLRFSSGKSPRPPTEESLRLQEHDEAATGWWITTGAAAVEKDWPEMLQHLNHLTSYCNDHMDKRMIRKVQVWARILLADTSMTGAL